MSQYNGWSDVPLTPEETWAERAEAFRRGITSKKCTRCGLVKPLDEFQRRAEMKDGRRSACRQCSNAQLREQRSADPESHRDAIRRHRERNREAVRERDRQYRRARAEQHRASVRESVARNPEKTKARKAVHRAILSGAIERPSQCSRCGGSEAAIHAHHDDYSRPLDVRWLCTVCHGLEHRVTSQEVRDD